MPIQPRRARKQTLCVSRVPQTAREPLEDREEEDLAAEKRSRKPLNLIHLLANCKNVKENAKTWPKQLQQQTKNTEKWIHQARSAATQPRKEK